MSDSQYLFDANAVVDLIDEGEYDLLWDEATVELMFYEATNVLWKFSAHRQRVPREKGRGLVNQLDGLRNEMRVFNLVEFSATRIYEAAWETSLTVYDAVYVVAAEDNGLTLVTNDGGIHDHAPDGVAVISSDDIKD